MKALAMNINTVMDALQQRDQWRWMTDGSTMSCLTISPVSTSPPNTTIEGDDAHGEDEETQRHGLPPSQSINSPQCHQQPCVTVQNANFHFCKIKLCLLFILHRFIYAFIYYYAHRHFSKSDIFTCHCSKRRGVTNNVNHGPGTPKWNAAIINVIIKILPKCPQWENSINIIIMMVYL